jgi:hypothetical protein
LIRLIPDAPDGSAESAIKALLAHRFPARCTEADARDAWREILEGDSPLWLNIPGDRKVRLAHLNLDPAILTVRMQETIRSELAV